jgi:hypothetical protein
MIEAATIAAIASGMPITVSAVTASAVWKDGFILFIPSYLRQDLAAICGGARKSVRQANRMTRGKFAIAGANLTPDSRYRVGTPEQQRRVNCTASWTRIAHPRHSGGKPIFRCHRVAPRRTGDAEPFASSFRAMILDVISGGRGRGFQNKNDF